MDDINELYEDFIDQIINDYPLTTSRLSQFNDAININQQIINRISSIRQYLQTNEEIQTENETVDDIDTLHLIDETVTITDNNNLYIDTLFEYLIDNTLTTVGMHNFEEFEDVKVTLTTEQFNNFTKKKAIDVIENIINEDPCNICMENYKNDEIVVLLKCNHYFHEDCIKNWLCNEKVTCPICRKDTREMLV